MASLLDEFKGKIDLIYIDPPFDVGADFTMDVPIGDEGEVVAKDQSTLVDGFGQLGIRNPRPVKLTLEHHVCLPLCPAWIEASLC
jgi:hypothetical protein